MEYIVQVSKKFRSCRWNGMRVKIIEDQGTHAITESKKGKKLRFHKKWLKEVNSMNEEFKQGDIAECPYCGTEFQDDFDQYFEHVSACWQEGRHAVVHDLPSV